MNYLSQLLSISPSFKNRTLICHQVTRYTHVMGDCVPESLLPALSDFLNEVCSSRCFVVTSC